MNILRKEFVEGLVSYMRFLYIIFFIFFLLSYNGKIDMKFLVSLFVEIFMLILMKV